MNKYSKGLRNALFGSDPRNGSFHGQRLKQIMASTVRE